MTTPAPPSASAFRLGVQTGDGLVGRFGDTIVLVAPDAGTDDGDVTALLGLVSAESGEAQRPISAIVASLAGWIAARPPTDRTTFGLVGVVPNGYVVLLRGAIWCEVVEPGSTRLLSGHQALTWVDQVITGPVEQVAIGIGDERSVRVHPASDLRAGTVPGSAFVLISTADAPSATAARIPDPAAPEPAEAVVPAAVVPPPPAPPEPRQTLPPATARRPLPAAEPATAVAPDAVLPPPPEPTPTLPSTEGATMGSRRTVPLRAPAQPTAATPLPIGALTCEGGPTIPLDRDYVLGRDPLNDPAVKAALASPITLPDPHNLISRVHLYVQVQDGAVLIRDAPSVSGTFVAAPGAGDWTRLDSTPTPLPPGWSLRVGTRAFVYEPTPSTAAP